MKCVAVVVGCLLVACQQVAGEAEAQISLPQGGLRTSIPGGFMYSFNTVHPTPQVNSWEAENKEAADAVENKIESVEESSGQVVPGIIQPWTNTRLYNGNPYYYNYNYNALHPTVYNGYLNGYNGYWNGYNGYLNGYNGVYNPALHPNQLLRWNVATGYPVASQPGYYVGQTGYLNGQPGMLAARVPMTYQAYFDSLMQAQETETEE